METWRLEQLETEANARITWGESPTDVRAWLLAHDVEEFYVDAILRDCLQRRAREMRALGIRNLIFGGGALLLSAGWGLAGWMISGGLANAGTRPPAALYVGFFLPFGSLVVYGSWQCILAFDRLVFGARADGAVSDVE